MPESGELELGYKRRKHGAGEVKSMEQKTFNEIKIRKPMALLYYPVVFVLKLLSKIFFKLKIDKKGIKGLKGPFVVMANHCSMIDIVFNTAALLPRRLNIVAGKDLFTWKKFKPFITKLGCIPKSQSAVDVMAIKMIKAALEQGRCVVIYPEGRISLDGKQLHYVPDNIGKLIKMLDVPVVFTHSQGAYLTKPRYYHGFKRGRALVKTYVLFTKEQVKEQPAKALAAGVRTALEFNDNIYQRENNIRFRSKNPAKGIDYILYKCPKCSAEYNMHSTDTQLICDACGNTVTYDEWGRFIPEEGSVAFDRIDLWYDYERQAVRKEISVEDFRISHEVDFLLEEEGTFRPAGEGLVYIDDSFVGYEGTRDGEKFSCRTPLKNLNAIVVKNKEGIDLAYPDGFYRFMFKEHKYSIKYGLVVEEMYRKLNKLDA